MSENGMVTSPTADREIGSTRVLEAPRDLVLMAFTEPNHVVHWWGQNGFTNTNIEMDVRPGGVWRYVMHGPDGTDYRNRVKYIDVVPMDRIVYEHDDDTDDGGSGFHTTILFEDEGGKTRLTMVAIFSTRAARDFVVENFNALDGHTQTLDRLEAYLAEMDRKDDPRQPSNTPSWSMRKETDNDEFNE